MFLTPAIVEAYRYEFPSKFKIEHSYVWLFQGGDIYFNTLTEEVK